MGSVYRETYTKPIPAGAELFTRDGKRFARWKNSKGRKQVSPVTTGKDGSDRLVVESPTYVAKYRDGTGLVCKVSTGCRDEDAARSVLSKLERRAELVRSEVITTGEAATADHQRTSVTDHFAAYHEHRTAKGLNSVRIANTKSRLERLAHECGFTRLSEMTADVLTRWLARQQAKQPKGMSAGNRNEYRQELVGFGNWCVETHRLSVNPFANVPKADANTDRRRQRRAMTEAELVNLLQVARWRPLAEFGRESVPVDKRDEATGRRKRSNWTKAALTLDGLKAAVARARKSLAKNPELIANLERLGRERALMYKTLVLTGLRKGELASLTVGQLELGGPMPFIVLDAADEKNRQGSTIPLRADLANDLKLWLSDNPKTTLKLRDAKKSADSNRPLFTVPAGLVRILDRDLVAAGIDKADERGRTIDVHALRTSFGTLLSKGGVAPRTAQAAMRHSTIDLTMNTYTDPKLLDVHGAMDSLPSLDLNTAPTAERQTMRATGTEDAMSSSLVPPLVPNSGERGQTVSFPVISSADADSRRQRSASDANPMKPSKKALPTVFVSKASDVERRGVEPPTSALRTQRSPN